MSPRAEGQKNNPVKAETGRQLQRHSDRTVTADLERFLTQVESKVNPWESDSHSNHSDDPTSEDTDGNAEPLGVDDPLNRTSSQLSKGRAPATSPLHPGCTSSRHKKHGASPAPPPNRKGPVKISNPPGPKRGHPNSLLPASSSPQKRNDAEEAEDEKMVCATRSDSELSHTESARMSASLRIRPLQMFGGVDELGRWDAGIYQMPEDEGQGFTDIGNAVSSCLGSGVLVLPSYFSRLASELRTVDWQTLASTIIETANAAAVADQTKANAPDAKNKSGHDVLCLNVQADGAVCGFWSSVFCLLLASRVELTDDVVHRLRRMKIRAVKTHLKQIWTSWQIAEQGLEEAALNSLLRNFKVTRDGLLNSCVASRPPWIARAEETLIEPEQVTVAPADQTAVDGLQTKDEQLTMIKEAADTFCLELAAKHHKLVGIAGPIFLDHLYRLSSFDGWFNCVLVNEWATYLDRTSPADVKVVQSGFLDQLRTHTTAMAKDPEKLEEWWLGFLRGTRKALSNDLSSKPVKDWRRSGHAKIFKLIQEWLHRLFLSLNSAIDWTECHINPCPENQPYQVNFFDCGPHTCLLMKFLCYRQTHDIHNLDKFITPPSVQDFRYLFFGYMMKLESVPIEVGEKEEFGDDSDLEEITGPTSEDQLEVSTRPATPGSSSPLTFIAANFTSCCAASSEWTQPLIGSRLEKVVEDFNVWVISTINYVYVGMKIKEVENSGLRVQKGPDLHITASGSIRGDSGRRRFDWKAFWPCAWLGSMAGNQTRARSRHVGAWYDRLIRAGTDIGGAQFLSLPRVLK
ncbi:hypothetical protein DFH07DRAFT_779606 [Mycena maculata]|uniref:Uncharacterized protein n=1 Tax=Mycena maculata TaxID=230809 RepID=A0AAD7MYL2_9AGAR|nr:hypothetical protein DFH07DRAFT_779606 [Mycena maculata]